MAKDPFKPNPSGGRRRRQDSDPEESPLRSTPRPLRHKKGPVSPAGSGVTQSVPRPVRKPPAGTPPPPPQRTTGNIEDTAIIEKPAHSPTPMQPMDPARRAAPGDQVEAFQKEREAITARFSSKAKRSQQRVEIDVDVKVIYKYVASEGMPDLDRIYDGMMTDISLGGTSFIGKLDPALTPEPLKDGSYLIGMNLCLPFVDKPAKVLGQAVRVKPLQEDPGEYEYGIKFLDLSDEAASAINSFLISLQMGSRKRLKP